MPIKFVEDKIDLTIEQERQEDVNNEFIRVFINTKLKKYLSFSELLTICTSKLISDTVDIIIKYINNYVSISNNDIYIYNEDLSIHHKLKNDMSIDEFLSVYIITFVEKSVKLLKEVEKLNLDKFYNTKYVNNKVIAHIKTNLTVKSDTFNNPKLGEIHFKNGYILLKDLTFHKRKRTDFMTYCIWRNFKNSPEEKKQMILKIINQIYPDTNDKNCVLECFGEAITGHSSKSQYNLFLLGIGSSGKSTLMKLCKASLKEMIFEFKEDTFAQNNNKSDRVLNMLMYNPYIRIMWVNELKGRIDDSLFKQVCEGQVQTTTLFQEGQNIVKFNALLVNTMNEFPNIKIDTGVERRIKSLEHKSKFTMNKNEVNENKNIYYADKDLISNISEDEELQNAFVEILCEYANDFLNGKRYELSKNFTETKSNIIDTNDIIKEFVEHNLITTNDEKDKIDIDEMHEAFKITYTNSKITKQQLLGSLKDKGLTYNSNVRSPKDSKKRGCFICIKFNHENDTETPIEYGFGNTKSIFIENETDKLMEEIEILKRKVKELENENNLLKSSKIETKEEKPKLTISLNELNSKIEYDTDDEIEKYLVKAERKPIKKNKSLINKNQLNKEEKLKMIQDKTIDLDDTDDDIDLKQLENEFKKYMG